MEALTKGNAVKKAASKLTKVELPELDAYVFVKDISLAGGFAVNILLDKHKSNPPVADLAVNRFMIKEMVVNEDGSPLFEKDKEVEQFMANDKDVIKPLMDALKAKLGLGADDKAEVEEQVKN